MTAIQELDREVRTLIRDGKATSRPAALALIEKSDPDLVKRAAAEKKQRSADSVKKVLQQFDAQVAKDAKRNEVTISAQAKLDTAVKELITKGSAVNVPAAIATLLESNPELLIAVQEELAAGAAGVDPVVKAQQVIKVTKSATDDATAQDQLMAKAREYYVSGRVATTAAGLVMALEHFPELGEAAIGDNIERNIL